jgi:hypothetical protein
MKKLILSLFVFPVLVFGQTFEDFSTVMPTTDNNMSVVFPAGTLSNYVGGVLQAYVDGLPVSASSEISANGSSGVAVIGTHCQNCNPPAPNSIFADNGETIEFAILVDDSIENVYLDSPIVYSSNGFVMINTASITFSNNFIFGCMDSTAINYIVDATIDNGLCGYLTDLGTLECGVTLEQIGATTSTYGFENSVYYSFSLDTISELILNLDGYSSMTAPYVLLFDSTETYLQTISYTQNYYINDTSLDLDSGLYYMVVTEDNPSFNSGSLQDYYSSMLTNYQNTGSFTLSLFTYDGICDFPGCTDPTAINFNIVATLDDGSCETPTELGTLECGLTLEQIGATTSTFGFDNSVYYSFSVDTASALVMNLDGYSTMQDPYVLLFDSTETYLQTISYTQNYYINETSLDIDSGLYHMVVTEDNPSFSSGSLKDYYSSMLTNSQNTGSFTLSLVTYDGSCDYPGCTDSTAFNFNSDATIEDGSCEYPTELGTLECGLTLEQIGATTSTHGFENSVYYSFSLESSSELILNLDGYSSMYRPYVLLFDSTETYLQTISYTRDYYINDYPLDLDSGMYHMVVTDGYPSFYSGTLQDYYSSMLTNYQSTGSYTLSLVTYDGSCDYPGCTDISALNFNSSATLDDESCEYSIDIGVLSCGIDTFINGSNNATYGYQNSSYYTFEIHDYSDLIITFGNSQTSSWNNYEPYLVLFDSSQNYVQTIEYNMENYIYKYPININPGTYFIAATYSDPNISDGTLQDYYLNMENNNQSTGSFTLSLTSYDGTCNYIGCTDSTAINYNPLSTEDDGSCGEICEWGWTEIYYNSDENGGSTQNSWIISDSIENIISSHQISYLDYNSGEYNYTTEVCMNPNQCYTFSLYDTGDNGWDLNSISIGDFGTYELPFGSELEYSNCTEVCSEDEIYSFWSNSSDISGFVISTVSGCTDSLALNYNASASSDNGICEYACENGSYAIEINMNDSYGDGWNGNYLLVGGQSFTNNSGYHDFASRSLCIDSTQCIQVTCGGGTWQEEVSWTISYENGEELLSGGAPYIGGIGGEECIYVINENFEPSENEIIAFGDLDFADSICLDISSSCYSLEIYRSSWASGDEASFVVGDQTYTYIDGSDDYYSSNFVNSVGNCNVSGCIDPAALNTHPYATVADASCEYINDIDTLACGNNYYISESTTSLGIENSVYYSFELDNHSEIEIGINDAYYTPYFILFDSAQIYLETILMSSYLDNFISLEAGKYYFAITSGNPEFTEDDGSCIYTESGCTDSLALNYSVNALDDDGTCEYANENGSDTINMNDNFECSGTLDDFISSMENNYQGTGSFNLQLTISDGNCDIIGCTNSMAFNYNPLANLDNELCDLPINIGVLECGFDTIMLAETPQNTYSNDQNSFEHSIYYALEIENDSEIIINLDGNTSFYNPLINVYDANTGLKVSYIQNTTSYDINNFVLNLNAGSYYMVIREYYYCGGGSIDQYYWGQTNSSEACEMWCNSSCNYLSGGSFTLSLSINDGTCDYPGCMDETALNYHNNATIEDGSCVYPTYINDLECGSNLQFGSNSEQNGFENSTYYEFEMINAGEIIINLDTYSSMYHPYITLFDSTGTYIQYISYTQNYYITDYSLDLEAGTYYMVVTEDNPFFNAGTLLDYYLKMETDMQGTGSFLLELFMIDDSCNIYGCTDSTFFNYNEYATIENGSCGPFNLGALECGLDTTINGSNNYSLGYKNSSYYTFELENDSEMIINLEPGDSLVNSYYLLLFDSLETYIQTIQSSNYYLEGVSQYQIIDYPLNLDAGSYHIIVTCGYPDFSSGSIQDYWVNAGTHSINIGSFSLNLASSDISCGYPGCADVTSINYDPNAVINDGSCEQTGIIECGEIINGNTTNSNNSYGGESSEHIYYFQVTNNSDIEFSTCNSSFDTYIRIFQDNFSNEIYSCDDCGNCGWQTIANVSLEPGNYFVLIEGNMSFSGDYELTMTCNDLFGCTDDSMFNYDSQASVDDGSCVPVVYGCITPLYFEYSSEANTDDGSCELLMTYGCTDPSMFNFDQDVTQDDGSCISYIYGCTNSLATNFDTDANSEDGSCIIVVEGCMNVAAFNYNESANTDDGSCISIVEGCTDVAAFNYNELANTNNGSCISIVVGCMDTTALNFDINANTDDGSCILVVEGCMDVTAFNYNELANSNDGSCIDVVEGCSDSGAFNYDESVNTDDSSCYFLGCIYDWAINYDSIATVNDGSCINPIYGCMSEWSDNYDSSATNDNGSCVRSACTSYWADNYDELATVDDGSCFKLGCTYFFASNYDLFATIDDGSCEYVCTAPSSWGIEITGVNHTLMIPADVSIQVNGAALAIGSTIGVFYTTDSGELQCAGYTSVTGEITFIAVMGDDSSTEEIDGLQVGEELVWMAWDINTCAQYVLSANYSSGSTIFTPNDISFLESLNHYTCQSIAFPGGWYMYSSYIQAEDMDAEVVLSSLEENLLILKDNDGNAYLTEWDFNGIGDLDFRQGYQIKTNTLDTIEICGLQMYPEANPLFISQGWNLISYLRESPSPVDVVLENMNSSGNLLLVKDFNGNPYLPEWNFNGIGDMQPGQGYQLKTVAIDTLIYLSNDLDYRVSTSRVINSKLKYFDRPLNTGNNMQIVIPENVWESTVEEGSEISAYNAAGNLVGATVYSNPTTVLTLWGNDVSTELVDGLLVNEPVAFKVWNNGKLSDFEITNWSIGANSYEIDAVNVVSAIDFSTEYALTSLFDATPNPSYQTTNISFFIVESTKVNISVYTILGELIEVIANSKYAEGLHEIEMNVSHLEAGSYFYTMTTADFKQTNQLIILKE